MIVSKTTGMLALLAIVAMSLLKEPAALAQGPNAGAAAPSDQKTYTYPDAKRGDQVDDYHGTKIADPYRWLEDPDSADTRAWVEAENKVTFDFLNQIPERARIKERLTKLWDFERYDVPFKEAGRYFYFKNDGLQNQNVLY